ncbi:ATP-grasp ribosomal peptide maturase [Streptomyces sp. NPDC005012]|uniref:ATP-grasp ribosomal peptide maturase n=1 Tax=Streptomyces sp. NPDC005012 TaxID=3154558 RepID=UPI0033A0E2B0
MTVLILTCTQDVTADLVVERLDARGVPVLRMDPADLPGAVALSGEFGEFGEGGEGGLRGALSVGGRQVGFGDLRSVWVRRPGVPGSAAEDASDWLVQEASQALYGMLRGTGARWMNPPEAAYMARHKPWQLRLAQQAGLPVPATLITTVPRAARDFAARHRDLVVKPVSGTHPQDPPLVVPTSRVAPDADFDAVALGPTLLQRLVVKRADIRLTAVGDRLLAARKEVSPDAAPEDVDVRFAPSAHAWRAVGVPDSVAAGVRGYLHAARLAYGAFDFAEDAEGTWWFLECNQSGQFAFVELDTGQPVTDAVACWLAGPREEG